jgi:AcrR family transcriptional regulator
MADQLSATDWLDRGLKTLARRGFTALKAEPLAKEMGVSRGSFYWHFKDIHAFQAALLNRWREVAAEQIIQDVEATADPDAIPALLRRAFGGRLALESAVRTWAASNATAREAVRAIDRRRIDYIANLLGRSGLPPEVARARAQILYWAFVGFALSEKPLPTPQQMIVIDELIRMAACAAPPGSGTEQ